MSDGIPCIWMRGGTSKGACFLASDLPQDTVERDELLLRLLGSPDARQIDGIGGADPLTSKVAIIAKSLRADADIDYLFLQVFVDQALVTDAQNCGNILATVGQFAIEKNLFIASADTTRVRVYMVNSDQVATVTFPTPGGTVDYSGDTAIDGVPGTGATVLENFPEAAGSSCGALLPTGQVIDRVNGVEITCIDNGMPVVIMQASAMGITGYETREELDANTELKDRVESIRLKAGPMMNLGDVKDKSVPKMTLVAPPKKGGSLTTRTFIPHRCHASIGVLGAVSVATACMLEQSPAAKVATLPTADPTADLRADSIADELQVSVEHPIGETTVVMRTSIVRNELVVEQAAIVRTARKLFEGTVYPAPRRVKN